MKFLLRKDGATFPYDEKIARKAGFQVIEGDPSKIKIRVLEKLPPVPMELKGPKMKPVMKVRQVNDGDEIVLGDPPDSRVVPDTPPELDSENLLILDNIKIEEYGTITLAPNDEPDVDQSDQINSFAAEIRSKTKGDLREFALVHYRYELPIGMNHKQMVAQILDLERERTAGQGII